LEHQVRDETQVIHIDGASGGANEQDHARVLINVIAVDKAAVNI
jgi:hypothetical protein